MKSLNHAFSILMDMEQKRAYDIKIKTFENRTTFQNKKSVYTHNRKNSHEFQSTNHFFKRPSEQIFIFEEWRVINTPMHLFIYHPSIKGYKDNITCWYLNKPYITLPINNNNQLARTIQKRLKHIIPVNFNNSGNDEIEITIKLPLEVSNCLVVLDIVFDIYQVPSDVNNFVKDKMGFAKLIPMVDSFIDLNFL